MKATIYAMASAPGRAGVAVVRVSGPEAKNGLFRLTGLGGWSARRVRRVTLRHPVSRETLDEGLAVFFEAPASYTGEDVAEYFLHGGRAVIEAVLGALGGLDGYRLAEPGEFTRRAFENDKLDLTGAEAVADLIAAETEAQRVQALAQLDGALTSLYEGWRERLVQALAHLDADLDFSDEDLPDGLGEAVKPEILKISREIAAHLDDARRGERLRDGIHVAILGAPNVGKSTLVNALAQREVSIVSNLAGTTRDIVEVVLDLGGYPVILSDTAGLRPAGDDVEPGHAFIEAEGIRRALARGDKADFRILVFDALSLPTLDAHTLALMDLEKGSDEERSFVVFNKCDGGRAAVPALRGRRAIRISARTGEGLDDLLTALTAALHKTYVSRETPLLTRSRHRAALQDCCLALERARAARLAELVAEDVRLAIRALGRIMGQVDVEEVLDVIFRDFCIGK